MWLQTDLGPKPLKANLRKLGIQFSGTPPDEVFVKAVTQESFGCIQGVQAGDELLQVDGLLLDTILEGQFKERLAGRPIRLGFSSPHGAYTVAADHDNTKLGVTFHGMPPGSVEVKGVTEGLFGSDKGVQEGDVLTDAGRDVLQSLEGMSAETFKSFLKDRPLRLRFQTLEKTRPGPNEDVENELPGQHPRTEYTVVASADTGKLGISFHSMPPGRIEVKGVAAGLFGSASGVKEGDVLIEVGSDDLQPLESINEEKFKGLLKDRPLKMRFLAPSAGATAAPVVAENSSSHVDHGNEQRMQSEMPATDGPPTDTYTIIAGLEVGKLGITFNGMPPGRIDVKGLAVNSFGNDAGVREGDALTEVGKDELMPLEGMDSETFKRLLKDRPLKMKFQSRGQAVAAGESVSPNDAEVAAPTVAMDTSVAEQETRPQEPGSREYTVVASADTGKLGISFHSMPPGRIEVKGVAAGLFGSASGVKEGDVLIEVGSDDLQPLESINEEKFKGLLKDRPLKMRFLAPSAGATAAPVVAENSSSRVDHGDKQRMQSEMPATDGPPTDTYTIIAGLEVGKLGITFNGMPPGRIDVKGLAENSFGNDAGVREGDALTEVGKDELMPLEGMDSETFKRLLKDRPLKMKFQSRGQAVAAGESVSPNDAEVAAPTVATDTSVAEQETRPQEPGSREYTVVASADTGKLGISFHSMPPGRIEVKGVAAGLFGSASGVKEGDVLIEVGSDDLQPLESINEEKFKGLLKDRPLKMRFLAPSAGATAAPVVAENSSSHVDHGDKQRMQSEMPATDGPPTDTYTIIAGLEVGKLGITFNGMPPGRIDVKGLAENSFGNDAGVREGDALTEVGKDELMPLEGMDSETFKRLLKDRPLKMKFQSRGQAVAAGESVSPNDAEVAAPTVATDTSVAEQETTWQKIDIPADASDEREIMPSQAG